MSKRQIHLTPPPTVLDQASLIQALLQEAIAPLLKRIAMLEASQSEWVDTKEAKRITGLKRVETLKAERERPGTLLVVKYVGKNETTPIYLRYSLLLYNDSKKTRGRTARVFV